jgi:polyisoprenoid-binding protein YceI/rhodanese-related sulfurtransferase
MAEPILPTELSKRMSQSDAPLLLDVRLEDDYAAAHLPQARNNCVFEVSFLDRMADLAPDKRAPVCVYGAGEDSYEARMAAEKLLRAGYAEVVELCEGLEGWRSAGLPLESRGAVKATEPLPPEGWLEIDPAESRVEWIGRNLLNKHYGRIALKGGKLQFVGGQLAKGEMTLNMDAIMCQDLAGDPLADVLIAHLKSDDFFDVELYPEARFVITSVQPIAQATPGSPNLTVRGNLTLKGTTRPVEFAATAGVTPEGKAAAQAAFEIDRTLWHVLYGSGKYFRHLGGHLVNDLIEIQLRVVTR